MVPDPLLQVPEREEEERDSKEGSQHRKRRKRPPAKVLPIPPLPSASREPSPGGPQSCLRSPVFLVDRLLKGLFQGSPYTPPPMLSPIREGSGLYFNKLCSVTAQAGPSLFISSALGECAPCPGRTAPHGPLPLTFAALYWPVGPPATWKYPQAVQGQQPCRCSTCCRQRTQLEPA